MTQVDAELRRADGAPVRVLVVEDEMSLAELLTMAKSVVDLGSGRRALLFLRADRLEYFISCLVYLPRDRYTTAVDFADAGGDLTSLNVVVLDPSGKQVSNTSTPVQGASGHVSGTIQGAVTVPTSNIGTFTFNLSATDAGGSVSNVLTGAFRIVAASAATAHAR